MLCDAGSAEVNAGMHILVTGAAGLLGRHVVEAYRAAGFAVTAMDIVGNESGDIVGANLCDLPTATALIRDVDCVAHIASIPRPGGYATDDVFRTNMALMFNVLTAMETAGIKKLLFASSFSIIGLPFAPAPVQLDFLPIDQSHRAQPQDIYAVTKWLGEEMVEAWVRRTGGTAMSIRMPWIQTPESFFRDVGPRRQSSDAPLDLWAYIDARDAAEAFVRAARAEATGHERIFISADDTYSETPSHQLLETHYPDVELREYLDDHGSLLSNALAKDLLGFQPRYSWRSYPDPLVAHEI
ncbi:NAD-dependent epimerase/dehydratase family protein [Rhizobium sp. VS19-DR183]|uniref:NAD-dependent epimerase/dehydratase family protein n=2 Tax=Rhizobium TaxID=379 RepID=UPI001CCED613|nr:NAD(P)-dependent oxidoreductase [Rhizobium sp. VS19-DR183]MBZ5762510.1 NAD(P)-dependent oxidoreductase [Rhizobium sp. VS19-DR96]MBZ5768475.1 NAD(P)-dependent oxidoreductase [Rhizobium sp. VS19-DR129.2]MBZ5820309.1 NAD(P)-dependent oxidoreductase [Rhizobium sp. VS19-DR183]